MLTPQSEDWNKFWTKTDNQNHKTISWSKRRMMRILAPYMQKGKRVLDAGCGSGFFSKFFYEEGMQVVAIDFATKAIEITKDITSDRVTTWRKDLLSPLLTQEFSERFDLIFSDGLFEHFVLLDQDRIMDNLVKLLNLSGLLITFVPNRWSPWEVIRPFFMPGIEENPFTLEELVSLNERHRLRVIQQGGINTVPFVCSPEGKTARYFGMLLYTIATKAQ